ncbi:MAG: hypothetical protein RL131_749 [Bacteroidota bacterium]
MNYFCAGEMAERSNAAVLKTVDCNRSGGSNPSLSAIQIKTHEFFVGFLFSRLTKACFEETGKTKNHCGKAAGF